MSDNFDRDFFFFFFKQKPAYEVRISDLSSDVCSSDLPLPIHLFTIPWAAQPRTTTRSRLTRRTITSTERPSLEQPIIYCESAAMDRWKIWAPSLAAGSITAAVIKMAR